MTHLYRIFTTAILALGLVRGMAADDQTEHHFSNLVRSPDAVSIITETGSDKLISDGSGKWRADDVQVITHASRSELIIKLSSPTKPIKHLRLRWHNDGAGAELKYLGDAWERAYGDLEWKPLDPHRTMPWYFLATDGAVTDGYGVKTGAGALCSWSVDESNIVLDADVRCGGMGVELGRRELKVCTVICRRGEKNETPFAAAQAFCKQMCPKPVLPKQPVYGFNDWYCTYGNDTAANFLTNVAFINKLFSAEGNRPFAVVDDGWQDNGHHNQSQGAWNQVRPSFNAHLTMPQFADEVKSLGARPGLWVRPLIASDDAPQNWRLSRDSHFLDPSVPAVRDHIRQTMARFAGWGYDLIKHDYTTDDIAGRWGFEMGSEFTRDGWAFADRSRTTAEIVTDLYRAIREGAGKRVVILGCNTIGHLSAGIFEMQRIGDDTSGREWSRTRKMGVNCLAFRAAQQGAFFAVDADCAGQVASDSVPWEKNAQWLFLLAHSGTPLFVSFPYNTVSAQQKIALADALRAASQPQPIGEPLDWLSSRSPEHWKLDGKQWDFSW